MYCPKLKPYIRYHEVFISALGHWPYQTIERQTIMRIAAAFSLVTLSVPLAVRFYKARHDFDYFLECLPMAVTVLLITWFYFVFFIIKRKHLLKLLNQMSEDFDTLQSLEVEFQILKESAAEGRFGAFAYIVYTIVSTIIYCGITLMPQLLNVMVPLNESRPRSYVSEVDYIFFDRDDYYFLSYLHTAIVGSYCVMLIVAADVMLYLFVQHACGMFRVLRYRLKTITNILDNDGDYSEGSIQDIDVVFKNSVSCAKMYTNILEFCESIDSCFSNLLLLCIGVTIVLLSFQGAMIIMRLNETEFVVRYATYAFAQIIHLLYNSVTGQQLLNHSSDATKSVYDAKWYATTSRVQKILLIMMMRSLKESKVTIGNMFILCLETYCSIMKTIFSYLSVLTSTRE